MTLVFEGKTKFQKAPSLFLNLFGKSSSERNVCIPRGADFLFIRLSAFGVSA